MGGLTLTECWLVVCVLAVFMLGTFSYQRYTAMVWQHRLQAHQQAVMAAQQAYIWQQRSQGVDPQAINITMATLVAQGLLPKHTVKLPMVQSEQLNLVCVDHCKDAKKAHWVARWTVMLTQSWVMRVGAWARHAGWQAMSQQGVKWYVQQPLQHFSRGKVSWSQAFADANARVLQHVT
jgi:hypothetical protein